MSLIPLTSLDDIPVHEVNANDPTVEPDGPGTLVRLSEKTSGLFVGVQHDKKGVHQVVCDKLNTSRSDLYQLWMMYRLKWTPTLPYETYGWWSQEARGQCIVAPKSMDGGAELSLGPTPVNWRMLGVEVSGNLGYSIAAENENVWMLGGPSNTTGEAKPIVLAAPRARDFFWNIWLPNR